MVDGQRLNVWSGEIHYWRAPDVNSGAIYSKRCALTVTTPYPSYFSSGAYTNLKKAAPSDFSKGTIKDLDLLLTMAQEEGLHVIARPGPYVNAEISSGWFAA